VLPVREDIWVSVKLLVHVTTTSIAVICLKVLLFYILLPYRDFAFKELLYLAILLLTLEKRSGNVLRAYNIFHNVKNWIRFR
jgi:hypothetical protein